MDHLYKNQLQNYAQRRNLTLPTYSSMRKGPPHARRFKCKVTFDGRTYESQEFFPTLKEAEHRAAKVVKMSLSPDGIQEDYDSDLFKNLLQELAQKEGYDLPIYNITQSGVPHKPIFVSTVEVQKETFRGLEAKTKRLAKLSAAQVAYMTLKERKPNQEPMIPSHAQREQANHSSSNLQENVITDPHQNVRPSGALVSNSCLIPSEHAEEDRGKHGAIRYSAMKYSILCTSPYKKKKWVARDVSDLKLNDLVVGINANNMLGRPVTLEEVEIIAHMGDGQAFGPLRTKANLTSAIIHTRCLLTRRFHICVDYATQAKPTEYEEAQIRNKIWAVEVFNDVPKYSVF